MCYNDIAKIAICLPGRRRLLHIFIGEDDFSIRQALGEIKKTIGDATALMTNTTVLDGRQVTPEALANACETVPFLAEKRLVIVEGLLESFEPAGRTVKRKAPRQAGQAEEYRLFADVMKKLPPFTELVVLGGRVNQRHPLLRELAASARVVQFPLLKGAQLVQWVERRVAGAGGSITPSALSLLVRLVGNDLWTMSGEVAKLIQYAGGRRIEEADVKSVVSSAQEASVFAMVDAILEFRAGAAQGLLQQLFRQGNAPAQLLAMLARQVRIIFLVKEMRDRGRSRGEIQSALGLNSDFLLRKAWEQADKYSLARLKDVFHKLLEADMAIKTGKLEGEIALDILVAELGQKGAVSSG
jgi:DNA polymerase-3 subunit delta